MLRLSPPAREGDRRQDGDRADPGSYQQDGSLKVDALLMARMQFAANITFHILFPTITIGLGWTLLFFRVRWLATHDRGWLDAYRFWTKVFALSFALGLVRGITMSFHVGTHRPGYMEKVGNIAGPLLGC